MFYRVQPYSSRGVFKHDGADKSQEESGEDVGGGRGHVRSVLFSGSHDELAEVRPIEGCPECRACVWHTLGGGGVRSKIKRIVRFYHPMLSSKNQFSFVANIHECDITVC